MDESQPRLSAADFALRQARERYRAEASERDGAAWEAGLNGHHPEGQRGAEWGAAGRSATSDDPPAPVWSLTQIDQLPEAVPTPWVWPGYLARGASTLLVGTPKAGKTTLISALLRDLQTGSGLVQAPIDGPIVVVSEEGTGIWAARRDKFQIPNGVHLVMRPFKCRSDIRGWIRFIGFLAERVKALGVGLVVIDTLASTWSVESENDAAEVQAALMPLVEIAEAGASLLIVHHPTKAAVDSGFSARGSGALTGWCDIIVKLSRYDETNPMDTRRKLEAIGRFDDIPPDLVVDFNGGGYSFVGEPWKVERLDRYAVVAEIVAGSDSPLSAKAVRERWPEDRKPSEREISAMLNEGSNVGKWSRRGTGQGKDPFEFFPTKLVGTYGTLPPF